MGKATARQTEDGNAATGGQADVRGLRGLVVERRGDLRGVLGVGGSRLPRHEGTGDRVDEGRGAVEPELAAAEDGAGVHLPGVETEGVSDGGNGDMAGRQRGDDPVPVFVNDGGRVQGVGTATISYLDEDGTSLASAVPARGDGDRVAGAELSAGAGDAAQREDGLAARLMTVSLRAAAAPPGAVHEALIGVVLSRGVEAQREEKRLYAWLDRANDWCTANPGHPAFVAREDRWIATLHDYEAVRDALFAAEAVLAESGKTLVQGDLL